MSSSLNGIDDLQDDDIEGSVKERSIFNQVFFGCNSGSTTKRCLVTGAVVFERDISEAALSSDSLQSTQASSKDAQVWDDCAVPDTCKGNTEPDCSPETLSDGQIETAERVILPSGSSMQLKVINNGVSCPVRETFSKTITCRLVESSSGDVIYSSYLIKKSSEVAREGEHEEDVLACQYSCLKNNNFEEVIVSKSVASPISQESFADKVLVLGPSNAKVDKSTVTDPDEREKELGFHDFHLSSEPGSSKFTKDPRRLIQDKINHLLEATGWHSEKRKRRNSSQRFSVYLSPNGKKSFREFPKVWQALGQELLGEKFMFWQQTTCKTWTDIEQFSSDLSDAMILINKCEGQLDQNKALANIWILLHPFVLVAYIDKKIGVLRKRNSRHLLQDNEKALQSTESLCTENSAGDGISATKTLHKKSKKISEIKVSSSYWNEILYLNSYAAHNIPGQREFRDNEEMMGDMRSPIEGSVIINERVDFQDCNQVTTSTKPKQQKKVEISNDQVKDDELIVSEFTENKYPICSDKDMSINVGGPKCKRKSKSQGSRHESRAQNAAKSRHLINGVYIPMGPRTVLSWLIDTGIVLLNDVIQYRDARYRTKVKRGLVTRDGILCRCCNVVFPVSQFKAHSGANQNHPFSNLFLRNGKSYTACLLKAWSADYMTRKASMKPSDVEDLDNNDDTCGICGDGGDLICCDGCPSTFHQMCLATRDLPDGNWYCSSCTCRICGDLVTNSSSTLQGLECKQCRTKYHEACLTEMGLDEVVESATWFCGRNCEEIYLGLQAQVGVPRDVSNGFSSTLLKCFHDDQKLESPKLLSLKAECNSKLAVGLSIMEESFSVMSDPRTGISMIPHMVYNCGSNFARMDFHGFYTVVLEKGDILTSVASIRIHGVTIAEMPMVATCSRYRRQGMCRRLMDAIEEILISLKIEKLVVSALPDLVETWTVGFGFQPLEDYEKESLSSLNLMVLPGTILLKKLLYSFQNKEPKEYEQPCSEDDYSGDVNHRTISLRHNSYIDDREAEDDNPEPNNDTKSITAGAEIESQMQMQFSKFSCN